MIMLLTLERDFGRLAWGVRGGGDTGVLQGQGPFTQRACGASWELGNFQGVSQPCTYSCLQWCMGCEVMLPLGDSTL